MKMIDTFPYRLKKARIKADMTQIELANALKVSEKSYRRWEQGEGSVKHEDVIKFCKITKADPVWLLFGADAQEQISPARGHILVANLEDENEPVYLPETLLSGLNADTMAYLYCDSSIMGSAIPVGSLVIIDTDVKTLEDGYVFALRYEGSKVIIARCRDMLDGTYMIQGDDEKAGRMLKKEQLDESIRILGRVVCSLNIKML